MVDCRQRLAGYGAGRGEGGETGGACLRPWALVEPRHKAVDIDGGGNGDVLQVGLRLTPISGPAQAKGADPLGKRPFDAGPPFIELLARLAGRPRLRRLQRLVLVLGREPQPSTRVLGTGTGGPYGTRLTCVLVEFDNDRATALPTPMLPPRHRHLALGAAHLLLLPVHRKLFEPTFKGVWSTVVNFALWPPPDTKPGQYPQHHKRSDDSLGLHALGGWTYCPQRSAQASLA